MRSSNLLLPAIAALAGLVCLIGLGVWQLQRLDWKEGLIARIEARAKAPPKPLQEILSIARASGDVDYYRVRLTGEFRHAKEAHLFTVIKGVSGWRVITALETGATIVFVDRGFVPGHLKAAETRPEGQVEGPQDFVGFARAPGQPSLFTPETEPGTNQWFWRNLDGMAAALLAAGERHRLAPFFVEVEAAEIPGGWPRPGVTRLKLPNKHLEYALTWFALAATLVVVFGFFAWSRRGESARK